MDMAFLSMTARIKASLTHLQLTNCSCIFTTLPRPQNWRRTHSRVCSWMLLAAVAAWWQAANAAAATCGGNSEIVTDRPDVTNSSVVVPLGALQSENGVDLISGKGAQVLTGTNSRLRLGVSSCFEVLVDLPAYSALLSGLAESGLSNVTPALKWQISPVPGKFDLSVVAGVGLPIGGSVISGPGVQPYLQFPWSVEYGTA
jgi:hypothetical protein